MFVAQLNVLKDGIELLRCANIAFEYMFRVIEDILEENLIFKNPLKMEV
jgi:hypothetical protein